MVMVLSFLFGIVKNPDRTVIQVNGVWSCANIHHTRTFFRGRSLVRPSGTEDCVRVYAEAATKEEADRLAAAVGDIVKVLKYVSV